MTAVTETQLEAYVEALAGDLGLLVHHEQDSRRSERGFPDLVIVGSRVLWVELKSAGGQLRPDQVTWRYRLQAAGAEWRLWRPADWASGSIQAELGRLAA